MRARFALGAVSLFIAACASASAPKAPIFTAPVGATPPEVAVSTPIVVTAPTAQRSPARLAELFSEYERLINSHAENVELAEIREAIDIAAGQRDAVTAGLFWYTDLARALAEAKRTSRPVLSLRLLGRLDEELSCANSRYFRIALYANEAISKLLRDGYVLHWQSERPVPRITVDFGDGRVVERTITGNSVHYVLDANGRVVDALPGLFGPVRFESALRDAQALAAETGPLTNAEAGKRIAQTHERMLWKRTAEWRKLMRVVDPTGVERAGVERIQLPAVGRVMKGEGSPLYVSLPATVVNELTVTKADGETPLLALMQPELRAISPRWGWNIAQPFLPRETLDLQSRVLLRSKHPRDWSLPTAPPLDGAQFAARVAYFEKRLTVEGAVSEFALHSAIRQKLVKEKVVDLAALDEYVYTSLFLSPANDAWLGLAPLEAVTGIDGDGIALAPHL